jgi:uncharacterized protein YxjI
MPIPVTCKCGATYTLGDEFAGLTTPCPECNSLIEVPAAVIIPGSPNDPAFDRDKFLLRQKFIAISEKYYVWDEEGKTILFVERPRHLLRNLLALLIGIITFMAASTIFLLPVGLLEKQKREEVVFVVLVPALAAAVVAGLAAGFAASKKRHVTFYRDDKKTEPLLEILQEQKFFLINAYYTVRDAAGNLLGRLHKNYIYNILRKRWYCYGPDGKMLCVAKEDSIILSLLRRFLGPLFGLLRTNFIFIEPQRESEIGQFNRKFTILDRYVLDMTSDPNREFDRRLALALGVMLDTGERR